jgi:UDP-N-acetylmuramyl tripeptide synthase
MDHMSTVHQHNAKRKRRPPRRRSSLRAGLAVVAGRTAGALSRRFHLGGGTSVVGVVAQRFDPNIVHHLATQLEHGSVIITGTNGKTTTSGFAAAIVRDGGLRVWQNREGSNLVRGIASSLVIRALPNGKLRRSGRAISILEVDEAALPQIVSAVTPRVVVFTNLFRDQLDRYGEVDSVVTHWKRAIKKLPASSILVLNADDPAIARLGEDFPGQSIYYGIEDNRLDVHLQPDSEERLQVIDTRTCSRCGSEYAYTLRLYSHMGHYTCPNCGAKRPQPQVSASAVQIESFDRLRVRVTTEEQQHDIVVPLPGLYNVYNALAAAATAMALGIEWEPITSGIEQFKPAFGRGERIQVEGRTLRLLLAKNPTGFNEVMRTLFNDNVSRHVLFILNDNIADGRDISWIWDVDFERMVERTSTLTITGTRALDLALRLKYAGVQEEQMNIVPQHPLRAAQQKVSMTPIKKKRGVRLYEVGKKVENNRPENAPTRVYGFKQAINTALASTPEGETLFVIPTYTGLLEVHRELESRGFTARYWEGKDA